MTEAITVRRFSEGDEDEVSRLIIDNLMNVVIAEYGQAAVSELASFYSPAYVSQYARDGDMYLAVAGGRIVGTVSLQGNRVRHVFVRTDRHRQGIGRALLKHLEGIAVQHGLERLDLRGAIGATDFYRRSGYTAVREVEKNIGNARFRMVVMEKILFAAPGG